MIMPCAYRNRQSGFTLVELLVVIALFGIFAGAVYALYIAHMKTVLSREEVLDVQQNVRIAMDRLTRDMRMAGFLVSPAIDKSLSNYSTVSIRTASADSTFASINSVIQNDEISAVPAAAIANYTPGDTVTIIRPSTKAQLGAVFSVLSLSTDTGRMKITPAAPADELRVGDMVCKATGYPDQIRYRIDRSNTSQGCNISPCLTRNSEIIAQGINQIRFDYFLDGANDTPRTDASILSDEDIAKITAIRVTVTGQTSRRSDPADTLKTRELKSLVKLRNYR